MQILLAPSLLVYIQPMTRPHLQDTHVSRGWQLKARDIFLESDLPVGMLLQASGVLQGIPTRIRNVVLPRTHSGASHINANPFSERVPRPIFQIKSLIRYDISGSLVFVAYTSNSQTFAPADTSTELIVHVLTETDSSRSTVPD
jgi:hypothetical protein